MRTPLREVRCNHPFFCAGSGDWCPDSDPLGANDLLWTCASCGADYTRVEMLRALKRGKNKVIHLMCTTCGAVGNFVDGPDA